jgi:hypothetical protein
MPRFAVARDWASRHPVVAGIGAMLLWQITVFGLGATPDLALQPDWFPGLGAFLVNLIGAIVILAVGAVFGVLRSGGILTLGSARRWVWLLPLFLLNFVYLAPGIDGGPSVLVSAAFVLVSVGISEELAGRGVALQLARPVGDHASAWVVGAVFGLGHIGNYLFFGANLEDTLYQIVGSALFGFCLGAARFLVGSVWPLALIHAMDDWMQLHSPGAAPFWFQLFVMAFDLAFGYVLLAAGRRLRRAG